MSPVTDGRVVAFHYRLSDADTGELLDDSQARDTPMLTLQGAGTIVRGLDAALRGRLPGESFEVTLAAVDAYGVRQGEPLPIPKSMLPDDAEEGGQFLTRTPDGRPMMLWITKIDGDQVWVDPHHPLAGRRLTYAVTVVGHRDATPSERRAGHPEFGLDDA